MAETSTIRDVSDSIKQGGDVVRAIGELSDAVQETYKKFDGATEFKDRHRSLELLIINGSKHKLVWSDCYFDSGTTFWGPIPMNIEPGAESLWAVANRSGSIATGVTGSGKWLIEETDSSFIIGFNNPQFGSYKNIVGICGKDESPQWGYNNSENENAKQFTQSGFYVRVYMDEPKISPYRRFVYCIADA